MNSLIGFQVKGAQKVRDLALLAEWRSAFCRKVYAVAPWETQGNYMMNREKPRLSLECVDLVTRRKLEVQDH